ncbi:hypothetical protein F5890DRAFT_1528258 [Lentinula detonsa]|uniref:Alpha-ketoglutarate-dependent dioxygenase AlkB-like domain-containing protein n=1 Tax=Lentinula detonsa TaxID=2804962 RepID=A0AA38PWV9_9AGAR|nr:hypothetical protein F5890DRAFT_1528258 [Lentinula detonsa]
MLSRRLFSLANLRGTIPSDFHFVPDFFSVSEQRTLLSAALERLDAAGSRRFQKRRKNSRSKLNTAAAIYEAPLSELFLPDDCYEFLQGHYDGVIHNYREMHLTSWPTAEFPGLVPALSRLQSVLPSSNIQTHLLHLASDGEILPHVDNVSASGRWILGVSLGSDRILRLESCANPDEVAEILLPSGSIYIQSDTVRYQYKHSILRNSAFANGAGQRMSIMIRDVLEHHSHTNHS